MHSMISAETVLICECQADMPTCQDSKETWRRKEFQGVRVRRYCGASQCASQCALQLAAQYTSTCAPSSLFDANKDSQSNMVRHVHNRKIGQESIHAKAIIIHYYTRPNMKRAPWVFRWTPGHCSLNLTTTWNGAAASSQQPEPAATGATARGDGPAGRCSSLS